MKTDKEININEVAITIEVDSDVIGRVRSGAITHIGLQLNDDNQNLILENINGNLVLVTDEMPLTYHGCYLYNDGEFPYIIKGTLQFLVLDGGDDDCLVRIIGVEAEPGSRFRFQGPGKPSVEDEEGDSCLWEITFEVVPVPAAPRAYLMRWNPAISSFTEKDYEKCLADMEHGMFRLNWSIYEWQEARRGDFFYMMRVGDDKAGIVFRGQFTSDPYPADDWAGSSRRRMYVDMVCSNGVEPGAAPPLSLVRLQSAIPEVEWAKGHSGVLLSKAVVGKVDELMEQQRSL